MTITWCMVPEIWSTTNIFFCNFGLLFALLPLPPPSHTHTHTQPKKSQFWNNEKKTWRYYNFTHVCHIAIIWCMVWSMTDQIFCHFGPIFAFYLTNDPKNQNFKKWKNHTQVKVGHTSEFLLDSNWWTWKTTIKRTVEPIKNVRILIFTIMYFKKKIKKNCWRYHQFKTVHQKSWWYIWSTS